MNTRLGPVDGSLPAGCLEPLHDLRAIVAYDFNVCVHILILKGCESARILGAIAIDNPIDKGFAGIKDIAQMDGEIVANFTKRHPDG